jgi:hypothetical protein
MSKRLQVLIEETEYAEIQELARAGGMTTAEWVRTALRRAKREYPHARADRKLAAIEAAAMYGFPTADIDQMVAEIEQGYGSGLH